ncbi:MAG: outer membrane beta-barrel protein [Deltaproteobacteria bacterium]|nr:outer membrane beta-barrel protein [Deltaproteobacteria bacterium]
MQIIDTVRYIVCMQLTVAVAFVAVSVGHCQEYFSRTYVQGYVGAAGFDGDSLTFVEDSNTEPGTTSTTDLSTMPFLGLAGQFAFSPDETHCGIDASLLFGWRSDDSSVTAGNGQARIEIDSSLWLLDLAIGLYAQTTLGTSWRIYAAAGPVLLFGEYSGDTKDEDLTVTPTAERENNISDSAFGAGGYAKLGLEYALSGDSYIGVAIRGLATNLDFDSALDDDGLTGIQGFITFTRRY